VEPGLDWVAGDRVAIAATSYESTDSEDHIITGYDSTTGVATLTNSLRAYHWGQSTSTLSDYGVDMRGEVVLLTRPVKIVGEDIESWGCQIVTSDTIEVYPGQIYYRYGSMVMENVEIHNCSQIDTEKAAIRFESANQEASSITGCSIHNGYGWAIKASSSSNIVFRDNVIFNFRPIGVNLMNVKNVVFDRNIVMHIVRRTTFPDGNVVDMMGGVIGCSLPLSSCPGL
jgi:hypothetical protein